MNFLILLIVLLFSCKGEEGKSKTKNIQINNYLTLDMKAKVPNNDKFDVFFSEFIIQQYRPEDLMETNIIGINSYQNIIFKFLEETYPIKLRLDLGSENQTSPVEIKSITFSTADKSKVSQGEELRTFFKPNKYISKEAGTNIYNRKIIDNTYDLFLVSVNTIITNLFN
jgi:hypothetical protein